MRASKTAAHVLYKYMGHGTLGVVTVTSRLTVCRILNRPQQKRVQEERLVTV